MQQIRQTFNDFSYTTECPPLTAWYLWCLKVIFFYLSKNGLPLDDKK